MRGSKAKELKKLLRENKFCTEDEDFELTKFYKVAKKLYSKKQLKDGKEKTNG